MKKFEFLQHTADIKFRAYGRDLKGLFENSALAVNSIISRGKKIKSIKKINVNINAKDYESLLYKFIEEIIYFLDADNFIISKAKVKIKDHSLDAVLYGDDCLKYKHLDHIKSPTYAEMYVKNKGKMWEAQVVVDV